MNKILILVAACLAGCAAPCPPLPTMGATQTLQEYTLQVVQLYHQCRGDPP